MKLEDSSYLLGGPSWWVFEWRICFRHLSDQGLESLGKLSLAYGEHQRPSSAPGRADLSPAQPYITGAPLTHKNMPGYRCCLTVSPLLLLLTPLSDAVISTHTG